MMNMSLKEVQEHPVRGVTCSRCSSPTPNKPKPILDYFVTQPGAAEVDFLTRFHADRSEDEQFNDEKAYLQADQRAEAHVGTW